MFDQGEKIWLYFSWFDQYVKYRADVCCLYKVRLSEWLTTHNNMIMWFRPSSQWLTMKNHRE